MKTKVLLFRAGTILILIAIAAVMLVIGRGHTVYFENSEATFDGQTFKGPYKVTVYVDGEQVAKLYDGERGMATCIGQTFKMEMKIMNEKGGDEQFVAVTMPLPRDMDGILINLPTLLAGQPEAAYLSEFIIAEPEPETETTAADEFGLTTEF
ncbi:MAG: hypothetical protein E7300_04790 [Lachnospiraceae bacterium]|nr:hypothetical protein [Lachnospiraceae bacterium]